MTKKTSVMAALAAAGLLAILAPAFAAKDTDSALRSFAEKTLQPHHGAKSGS